MFRFQKYRILRYYTTNLKKIYFKVKLHAFSLTLLQIWRNRTRENTQSRMFQNIVSPDEA